jgi:hypothetical protein
MSTKKYDAKAAKEYIKFLETAMASTNFKVNDPERYKNAKAKLEKERLKLKLFTK